MQNATTTGGTPTDPVWSYVVAALFIAFFALTAYVLIESVIRVLVRRAQQRRAMDRWTHDAASAIGGGL